MRNEITTPEKIGPAMQALTPLQRAFCLAASEIGGSTGRSWHTQAARMAGYTGTDGALRVTAHHLMQNPKIQAAMKELALATMSAHSVPLTAMLLDIAYGEIPSTASEKLKAAAMVFNRIGMPETTEHNVKVEHSVNADDAMARLQKFAKVLDLDPAKLLGHVGAKVVDGEFVEVAEESDDPFAFTGDE